ncbi:G-type lectin S-receptor-like serine/threonine-protein kinase LECRK1 [Neltuma alba]|uniref:G-type lectin S-receptor-like serine/threonine-protein kinase LECRK1 n=1 Tax=Neltuma alba TaxID=207710 RepID=UPI0010A33909|nr:G-type lectin S-receptor-like serine/threonine-protein kinase LECRK1 [Prosopis alba]
MAASLTLFLLFAVLRANQAIAEKNDATIIRLGSWLSPKSNSTSWVSSSGHFAFGFYPQGKGFAVGIWLRDEPENTIVWTAYRNSPPLSSTSVIVLDKDGPVLLRNETGKRTPITNSSFKVPAYSASMFDSGNFVIYDKNQSVIWQSFDLHTDTILGGQILSSGQNLVSSLSKSDHSSGNFILVMQDDGNLVAYPVNNRRMDDAYYGTQIFGYVLLTLNVKGFLCLVDDRNRTLRVLGHSNVHGQNTSLIYRATLDVDGIFRLYVHRFERNAKSSVHIVWQNLFDQCDVRGFCGFNSYCSSVAGKGVCHCYPGFTPINGNQSMFLDCEQTHKYECKTSEYPRMLYNFDPLQDLQLKNIVPYWVEPMKMETCRQACQEDCDCAAVLYERGNCNKFKLPLRFGRIKQNSSNTVFIKSPSGNAIIPNPEKPAMIHVDDKKDLILTLLLTLGSISFLCFTIATSIIFVYRRKIHSYTKLSTSANLRFTEDCSLRTFSFDELVNATRNFTEEVGRGSFGVVYKGTNQGNNKRIAVKKLDVVADEGEREFQAEITAIARTHHRNLVQLIGYCIDDSRKLLVYEYMSNGSLADFLFKSEMHLSWKQRVKIALDVARGVLYLHEECEVCIVHCNIKPQNILLDERWVAKISDFGLARLSSLPEHSRMRSTSELTSGYVAPERQKDASTSVKVDIYSYGVVLLEIICCRRNIDVNVPSEEEIMLSTWVYNCFVRGELKKLVSVDEDVEWMTLERMVKVALWCVQEDLSLRPSMKNVILMLEGLKHIPIPLSPIPLAS